MILDAVPPNASGFLSFSNNNYDEMKKKTNGMLLLRFVQPKKPHTPLYAAMIMEQSFCIGFDSFLPDAT